MDKYIQVRLTAELKAKAFEVAKEKGVKLSVLVRKALTELINNGIESK